ncbi:hypothetical protein FNV43_RR10492 [Rhamnella rubrinervis]|uniref:HTH La-type RNA-binding domain-containing protein n=1 Tax=Rhamnella rubrinervis TaxID=2594499 RepID=A0A8K0H3Y9_9ROSA|nr:hypothetical protein FNV43_RR10492 [Rhamnella rubrinervis]
MATAADSSSNHHSSSGPVFSGDGADSPHLRQSNLPSPWAQVVRGEPESIPAVHQSPPSSSSSSLATSLPEQIPFSDCSPSKAVPSSPPPINSAAADNANGNNGIAGRQKKPAWNKPSNGVVETTPTIDADSWPALSESTRASPKLSADPSSKPVADGSGSNAQLWGGHAHSNFTHPHPPPPPPPPPPPYHVLQMHPNAYANLIPTMPDHSPRDPSFRNNHWDTRPGGFVPQPHAVNDRRNSSRRNFGPHPHGDGTYRNNYGGRRDHDREFIYTMPMDPIRAVQFITHASPPAMFVPVADPSLSALLVNQIDYYFSDANLIKDEYLRSNMDDHGWVPISLIASFPRVKNLTHNIQLILTSLRASSVVEVQDDKVRKRNEWMKWISTSGRLSAESGSASPGNSSFNVMATSFQKMTMEEAATSQDSLAGKADPNCKAAPGTGSAESIARSHLPNGEVA